MPRIAIESSTARTVRIAGREYVYFGGCNYLGLAHAPEVRGAFARASERFGLSSGASRATSGNSVEHEALETELASFLGVECAVLCSGGWSADLAAIEALGAARDRAVIDERAHASLCDGARAANLELAPFRHADASHARELASARTPADARAPADARTPADAKA
jgi:7-keto-8-aminopelargonate synthetase-like enzyme